MFIFTMQATPYDFNNYLPVFENMLTSFKAPATSVKYYHLSDQNSHNSQSNNDPKKKICGIHFEDEKRFGIRTGVYARVKSSIPVWQRYGDAADLADMNYEI
jgi:hypothetical protein